MYEYIMFDLDGTISDPKVGICTSVQTALKRMGIEVADINELTPFIGPPLRDSFRNFYGIKEEDIERTIGYYRERFSTVGLYENELYDGIFDLLKELHDAGKKISLTSSKPEVFVKKILDFFKITEFFDVITGSDLAGKRENKKMIIDDSIAGLLGDKPVDLSKVVMVGDRKFDIEAAIEAGVSNIGVSYGYGSKEELSKAGADIIVDSVEELRRELLK